MNKKPGAAKLLAVVDSPRLAQTLAPWIRAAWPHREIAVWTTARFGAYEFDLSRSADFPSLDAPRYKPRKSFRWMFQAVSKGGTLAAPVKANPKTVLKSSGDIVYVGSRNSTGAMSFAVALQSLLGTSARVGRRPAVVFNAVAEDDFKAAASRRKTFAQAMGASWRYGLAKHYFDFNYHRNCRRALAKGLKAAGLDPSRHPISKYGLQALYFVRDRPGLSESELMAFFDRWEGTRKRESSTSLGSPVSYLGILRQNLDAGFIARRDGRHRITKKGEKFLAALPPACRDFDLPFRLDGWCRKGLDRSKPGIDRYLKDYFKSFLSA